MLITDVEATILRQPDVDDSKADGSQDALLIRIHTDEGITGIGEVDSLPPVIKAIVEAPPSHEIASGLKALLVGENPLETDRLWEKMYRGSIYYGRRGPAVHAISGIDIALWDIKGKVLGQPIYLLLGGPRRITVGAYASTLMPDNPRETTETVVALVARGFTAIKLGWGPLGSDPDGQRSRSGRGTCAGGSRGGGRRDRADVRHRSRLARRRSRDSDGGSIAAISSLLDRGTARAR